MYNWKLPNITSNKNMFGAHAPSQYNLNTPNKNILSQPEIVFGPKNIQLSQPQYNICSYNRTSQKNTEGYIYIICQENSQQDIYKIGKSVNKNNTISIYKRGGEIKKKFYPVLNHLNEIEAIILNILAPYRLQDESISNQNYLTKVVRMDIEILKHIIDTVTTVVKFKKLSKTTLCHSVNTLSKHRDDIPYYIWNAVCIKLDTVYPYIMDVPMDIDHQQNNFDKYYFDNFIDNIISV